MIMSIWIFLFTEQSKSLFEKTNPHKIDPVKKPRPKAQPSKTSFNPLENIMQAQEKLLDNPKHHKGMMVSLLLIITCFILYVRMVTCFVFIENGSLFPLYMEKCMNFMSMERDMHLYQHWETYVCVSVW